MTTRRDLFGSSLRLGYGCAGAWGMPWFSEREAHRLVLGAAEHGIAHFDTGVFYARGVAEERLGRIMRRTPDSKDWFISTKTGTRQDRRGRHYTDFSEEGIRGDVETSLTRLCRDRVDLLYLHGPTPDEMKRSAPVLQQLQQEGKIDRAGICGEQRAFACALDGFEPDDQVFSVVMGVFNILKQEHADIFQRAKGAGFATVAIAPLAQGLYNRGFFRPSSLADLWTIARAVIKNRAELSRARAPEMDFLHDTPGWTAAELALSYVLAQPFVDGAVAATTRAHHLQQLTEAAQRQPPAALFDRLPELSLAE
ncbi:MAG: aldo/keto reductase [Pseudomonadota bacterium]